MAYHKSAEKRAHSSKKKSIRNTMFLSSVKTAIKAFQTSCEKSDPADVLKAKFGAAQSALAKATSKGMLHRNASSRKIGKLSALLKKKAK